MSGVGPRLAEIASSGRAALVGYLPAGFPSVDESVSLVSAMVDAGVDVVEIGLPYSDPVMDGATIQDAVEVALAGGTRTRHVLAVVEAVAGLAPTLVMTYWNPVERYGVERFASDLSSAGGAGLITPDLIPDEAPEWLAASRRHDLDRVFLVAPSSTRERLVTATDACRGFVYATAVMGVTGARGAVGAEASGLVARAKEVTDLPVGVGLGVSTGRQAAEVANYADAVIVGSALVAAVQRAADPADARHRVAALAAELARGVRGEL